MTDGRCHPKDWAPLTGRSKSPTGLQNNGFRQLQCQNIITEVVSSSHVSWWSLLFLSFFPLLSCRTLSTTKSSLIRRFRMCVGNIDKHPYLCQVGGWDSWATFSHPFLIDDDDAYVKSWDKTKYKMTHCNDHGFSLQGEDCMAPQNWTQISVNWSLL